MSTPRPDPIRDVYNRARDLYCAVGHIATYPGQETTEELAEKAAIAMVNLMLRLDKSNGPDELAQKEKP